MWENRCKIAVSGVGYSQATRSAETPLAAHALQAVKAAVEDSGLQMPDIDGLATYPELPATGHTTVDGISIVSVNCMMAMLKLPRLTWHIQTGSVNIGGAVQQATNALLAGVCKYAVVWRAMHNPRGTYQNLPGAQATGPLQFTAPYGFGGPGQFHAVAYARWLERHNQQREKMATLTVTQRKHGLKNPHAFFKVPLTREEYLNSRMIAHPLCLYDCDIPVQGAVAIVLTTADRARDLKPRPAYLAGYGQRLVFEVAGDSLRKDREVKGPLFARAGVPEYVIVNLAEERLEVYREPDPATGRYRTLLTLDKAATFASDSVPGLKFSVAQLLA